MELAQKGFLTIIKSAITGARLTLPDGFTLEQVADWTRRHHVLTLIYDGAARCGVSKGLPVMQELFRGYVKQLQVSERQMQQVRAIFRTFEEHGIEYMPLKGCKLKELYPQPELRKMGDADILIRTEQYPKIRPLMESLGFAEKVESDHELIWENSALYLELHKRLIPSYNEDFYSYFGDGWKLAKHREGNRFSMSAEDEMVYLFTHYAKHFRDGGIGCRHVLDLWAFLRANPGLDEQYVLAELEKLQLREFYENTRRLIAVWFEDAAADEKTDLMTNFIFSSGSWGVAGSQLLSLAVRDSKHGAFSANSRLQYICKYLFPKADAISDKFPILKKAPWLLPIIWIIRPFKKLLFERNTLKQHEKNIGALSQDKVDERQRWLNYVGLDYNF